MHIRTYICTFMQYSGTACAYECMLFCTALSSDVDSLVREIVAKEPLISEHRTQQVQTLIKSWC